MPNGWTSTEEILPELLLYAGGSAPLPLLRVMLRKAAREFFARTSGWRYTMDEVPFRAGVTAYEFDVGSADVEIERIRGITIAGHPYRDYSVTGRNTIELPSAPAADSESGNGMVPHVALTVSARGETAPELPDEFLNVYAGVLCAGASWMLGKAAISEHGNPGGLQFHRREWLAGIGRAINAQKTGNGITTHVVRY